MVKLYRSKATRVSTIYVIVEFFATLPPTGRIRLVMWPLSRFATLKFSADTATDDLIRLVRSAADPTGDPQTLAIIADAIEDAEPTQSCEPDFRWFLDQLRIVVGVKSVRA